MQNTADHRATLPARTIRSFTMRVRPIIRSFGSGGELYAPAHTNNSCSRDNGRPTRLGEVPHPRNEDGCPSTRACPAPSVQRSGAGAHTNTNSGARPLQARSRTGSRSWSLWKSISSTPHSCLRSPGHSPLVFTSERKMRVPLFYQRSLHRPARSVSEISRLWAHFFFVYQAKTIFTNGK